MKLALRLSRRRLSVTRNDIHPGAQSLPDHIDAAILEGISQPVSFTCIWRGGIKCLKKATHEFVDKEETAYSVCRRHYDWLNYWKNFEQNTSISWAIHGEKQHSMKYNPADAKKYVMKRLGKYIFK